MSTLIVHKQTRRKNIIGLLQWILAPAIFFIWFPIFSLVADPSILEPSLRIAFFVAGLLSFVCLFASYGIARNMRRDADRLTCEMLGAKNCFDILSRLEKLVPSERARTNSKYSALGRRRSNDRREDAFDGEEPRLRTTSDC